MRGLRIGVAVAALVVALGCGGVAGMMPSGGIKTGADAVRPASFPMPEPPNATLETSAEMAIAGVSTVTVQYALGSESDSEILDLYEKSMKDAGLTTTRSDTAGSGTVSGSSADGTQAWTAVLGQESGKRTLMLVTISR